MWHRNSSVHPLDASRGPATKEGSARWTTAWGQRYVLKHKPCNSFWLELQQEERSQSSCFSTASKNFGKKPGTWNYEFSSLTDRHCWLSVSWTVHAFGCLFCSRSRIGLCGFESLIPKPPYSSRRDLLVIGKWMLDTEEKGCQKKEKRKLATCWLFCDGTQFLTGLSNNLKSWSCLTNKQNSTFCVRLQAVKG